MNNLKYKLLTFMQGRYGTDKLNVALVVLYLIIGFIRVFVKNKIGGIIISVIMMLLLAYILFRMLSKNIPARQKEYYVFCRFWNKVSPRFVLLKDRIRDIKTKRYRKCPQCKNILRLPYKRGKHSVKCPKCGKDFNVRIV